MANSSLLRRYQTVPRFHIGDMHPSLEHRTASVAILAPTVTARRGPVGPVLVPDLENALD